MSNTVITDPILLRSLKRLKIAKRGAKKPTFNSSI